MNSGQLKSQPSGQPWDLEIQQVSQSLRLLTSPAQGKAHLFMRILILGRVLVADELRLWLQGGAGDLILIFLLLHFVHT